MTPLAPGAKTASINVASSSANVQVGENVRQVRIMNNGSATVWIAFGSDNTVAATTTASIPVGPGVTEVLTTPSNGQLWIAAIAAGSTGYIYFTPGTGF